MARYMKQPIPVEAITFDELVQHGIEAGANMVNGMPWSFVYQDHAITHENDDCYLIPTLEGTMRFSRGDMLVTGIEGEIYPVRGDIFEKTFSDPLAENAAQPTSFITDLERTANRHSMENGSDTPDFILALFMQRGLEALNEAINRREAWYGRAPEPIGENKSTFSTAEQAMAVFDRVKAEPVAAASHLMQAAQKFRHYERLHREKLNVTTLTEPSRAAIQHKVDANEDMARQIEQFLGINPQ